ncbi:sugar-binding transcriptional regulator [Salinisphaera sp. USBA-960]|uniref:sugar-binding transcriptional regulator n=1 Tax=Salinisphaera orenii TaxID=856731 RepID=UPI000DBE0615|nr:sugar-binding transcriptional regulator [Salifodinibacter halophilus]NNC26419.1 sugar-binding transcriptional regulator [Salifodinibacter halophilus]
MTNESQVSAEPTWPVDPNLQTETRVAWYYYVGNLTQQQIADRLGTSRVRINRLLAACRESGVVQVSINSNLSNCVALEQTLAERYGLRGAVVVPTPEDEQRLREAIGVGAGNYLNEVIAPGNTVALGWGRTLVNTWRAMRARTDHALSVVSMLGGLAHCPRLNTFEITYGFAERLGAECHYLAAPIYASSREERDLFLAHETTRYTLDKARGADVAVLTAGDLDESLVVKYALTEKNVGTLKDAGAVGDVLGHFIDADGNLVDHELNKRTVALKPDDLAAAGNVVLVAGGTSKATVTRAALVGGYIDVLVTDEAGAEKLTQDYA